MTADAQRDQIPAGRVASVGTGVVPRLRERQLGQHLAHVGREATGGEIRDDLCPDLAPARPQAFVRRKVEGQIEWQSRPPARAAAAAGRAG